MSFMSELDRRLRQVLGGTRLLNRRGRVKRTLRRRREHAVRRGRIEYRREFRRYYGREPR